MNCCDNLCSLQILFSSPSFACSYITHPFHYLPTFSVMTTQVAVDAKYWVREGDKLV